MLLPMPWLPSLDRRSPAPLWKQIVDHAVRLADEGALPGGERLPPTRVLAAELGVNRSTVCRAYEELAALGHLESRPGSYTTVRGRARPLAARSSGEPLLDWDHLMAPSVRGAFASARGHPKIPAGGEGWIDFSTLSADPDLSPVDDLRRALRAALLEQPRSLVDYGEIAGYAPLRELLAKRMHAHGISVCPDEVLITQGAQQALDLVIRFLATPGSRAVVESPTYVGVVPLLGVNGVRAIEIPVGPDGMDLDVLESRLRRHRPAFVYTMPAFHNPTGVTTSQAHRERLLELCEARGVPIVEDGFEEEMKYFGRAVLPLKSMDARGAVLYVGTFSKVIFPGLRIGWIAAERECIRRLAGLARFTSLSSNLLSQAAVERFCHAGRYDRYLRRLHATFRRRMTMLLRCLEKHVGGDRLEWTRPVGGCTLWARVPGGRLADERALIEAAGSERLAITPGSLFFVTPPDQLVFRISISRAKVHEIEAGCRRLARALEKTHRN